MTNEPSEHVIGIFDDADAAKNARDLLLAAGFDPGSIEIVRNSGGDFDDEVPVGADDVDAERVDVDNAETTVEAMGGPIRPERRFWSQLLGFRKGHGETPAPRLSQLTGDGQPAFNGQRYFTDIYERGDHLVIVAADGRAAEAQQILRQAGAEVEPRAGSWVDGRVPSEDLPTAKPRTFSPDAEPPPL